MDENGRKLALLRHFFFLDLVSLADMLSRRYFCNLVFW